MCCSKCGKESPIVNKKYDLCYYCNFQRTHNGVSYFEHQQEKQQEYIKKQQRKAIEKLVSDPSKQRTPIKKQTSKEASVKSKLSLVKQEIRLEAIQNNEYYCKGCGTANDVLDCSHILSVSMFKHLELVKENIQLLCRMCHRVWEGSYIWEKMELLCFEENLEFIKHHDLQSYNKLFNAAKAERENYFKK